MQRKLLTIILTTTALALPALAHAEITPAMNEKPALSETDRLNLARQFVSTLSKKLADVQKTTGSTQKTNAEQASRLPEGENLLLGMRLAKKIPVDATLLGRVENKQILVSMRDFVNALEFPIQANMETGSMEGWYIREKNAFRLDAPGRTVTTALGTFNFSQNVSVADGDVMVPLDELGEWFGFKLELNVAALDINLESPVQLPVQERLERRKFTDRGSKTGPPVLPPLEEEIPNIDYPFVDVSNSMGYDREGNTGEGRTRATSAIRTTGDLAQGTLTTQTVLEKEDKLSSFRMNYKQESLEPELLGPLKAKRFELGDVYSGRLPLQNFSGMGVGARVTNADELRSTLSPSTDIRGSTFPGWDVELYREDQLLSVQTVGDDGIYIFEDVDLYTEDNNFRVVLYGPQGEIREEDISIPVDNTRLAKTGGAYDLAVTAQDTQTYRKQKIDNDDVGSPAVTALYEIPVGKNSALSAGFESAQEGGERQYVAHAGASTSLGGVLLNLDGAMDAEGETGAQLVARHKIGDHQIRNEIEVASDKFDLQRRSTTELGLTALEIEQLEEEESDSTTVFSERLTLNGPLPLAQTSLRPRYNLALGYQEQASGDSSMDYIAGISGSWKGVSLSEQLNYRSDDYLADDTLDSITTISGSLGRTRLRFNSVYEVMPENRLDRLSANVRRNLTKDVELDLTVGRIMDPKLTEGRAQINWDAGFANISPSVSYNSDRDLAAVLNTRFSLARDPQTGKVKAFERGITSNGSVSAFVFLDKNGDNIFNEDDEVLPDVIVSAPQNGGREITDEKGYVFFKNMASLRPTDVFVDPDSLQDPFWIPGFKGVSILPREGHVTPLQFPVHMAGEIDGTVFVRDQSGTSYPQRGLIVSLYDAEGNKVVSTISESDGFYLLQKVPPGTYQMAVDGESFMNKFARPKPQTVTIGYDGTILYGKNIYMAEGQPDVPVKFVSTVGDLGLDHEWAQSTDIFLNLGTYKSRLSMALAWFKIKSYVGQEMANLQLTQKPSESVPSKAGDKYILRAAINTADQDTAYDTCRKISAKGFICAVELVQDKKDEKIAAK